MTLPHRVGALAGLLLAAAPLAALAQPAPAADRVFDATTLNLSADGEVEATPDQASLSLGVQTHGATAAEAMAANATQMGAVMDALHKAGVPDRDIRTSNLSLQAQYSYPNNAPVVLQGYNAANDVTVVLNDTSRVGPVIDAATGAGANQVEGIGFGLKDSDAAQDAARQAAVKALAAKAALYAAATGYRGVRLVSLTEGGGGSEPIQPRPMAMMAHKRAPTPVSAGELTVRVDISGVYELTR